MGTRLGDIMVATTVTLKDLAGKTIAVDAFNTLYQFLSTIRQPDGTPLMDREGRVTSHLSGLFYRNVNLIEHDLRLVYVFDGEAPVLKAEEVEKRRERREAARLEWERAKEEGRIEDAFKAARASSRLTAEMIEESKALLQALGIPVVQAPSEGEALAAQMAREGIVWASASQDNDALLYNCPRMVRNLSISGRRRGRGAKQKTVQPEIIDLDNNLRTLGITREQLVDIAILVGTDYNPGVKGVGPKTALKLVTKYGCLERIEEEKGLRLDIPYQKIRDIFLKPLETELEPIEWKRPDPERVMEILCDRHDFNMDRVERALERLTARARETDGRQSSLTEFF